MSGVTAGRMASLMNTSGFNRKAYRMGPSAVSPTQG